jgi:6-pyruvoyltetrahydropterin/6-carboxytetrahydropterin synthase
MTDLHVVRRIHFCAGHRLLNHGGKCENLHGHNYVAEISVAAAELDRVGRVLDFAALKRLFKGWIDEHWDHGFILCDQDKSAIHAIESVHPHKIYRLSENPTAENLAKHLLIDVGPKLLLEIPGPTLRVTRVAIWETEDTCAAVWLHEVQN